MSKRSEWEALTEQEQYTMIRNCVAKAARAKGMTVDPVEHVGGVWLRVEEKLDSAEIDLVLLVWRCAVVELQQVRRHEAKALSASDHAVKGTDGETLGSVLELLAWAGSVEREAILRADFGAYFAGLDSMSKCVVEGLALGFTYTEISRRVGISLAGVERRVNKLREELRSCVA